MISDDEIEEALELQLAEEYEMYKTRHKKMGAQSCEGIDDSWLKRLDSLEFFDGFGSIKNWLEDKRDF